MEGVGAYLLTQGALGIATLVLGYVCGKLYNKNERLQARIEELHILRLEDSKEVVKEVTEVIQGNSQNMRVFAEKIEVVQQGKKQ